MAVDVAALENGVVSFAEGREALVFGQIATQVLAAAAALVATGSIRSVAGQPAIQWGGQPVGAWIDGVPSHFRDWGHFQLDPSAYPP
jgi:hypothetical protein